MDLIPIALSVMAGATVGAGTMALIAGGKIEELRETIAAKQARADEQTKALTWLGDRCAELRMACINKDNALGTLRARIDNLEPLAQAHLDAVRQRNANLAKAQAANRARQAAKLAGNVEALPERRRA
jgi:predicted  nucleic acid-binding Zn-ribbon protein